jgi:hypothetical protein
VPTDWDRVWHGLFPRVFGSPAGLAMRTPAHA